MSMRRFITAPSKIVIPRNGIEGSRRRALVIGGAYVKNWRENVGPPLGPAD